MRASEALDEVIGRERGWLDLTTMRLFTHPGFASIFSEFLVQVYHEMHTATALMEAARTRSAALATSCPVAARLVSYWDEHILEEAGHDEWLADDMRTLGMDVDAALSTPPSPTVAEIMGTLHFWVTHTHPVAAVGYFYFAERNVANVETIDHMASAAGVPPTALKTFYRHASIDITHGRELEELVDSLPLTTTHQDLLALSTSTIIRQLGRRTESLLLRAEQSARTDTSRSSTS